MRLVDTLLRQGHLSEQALTEALLTGDRPLHLDRCDVCADRAIELGRWLDGMRQSASDAVDLAFPPERLAAQQAQIFRRLEQLDEPARVIAFPRQPAAPVPEPGFRKRVAAGWLGVAAAAGIVIGAIGGQMMARSEPPVQPSNVAARPAPPVQAALPAGSALALDIQTPDLFDLDLEASTPAALHWIDEQTPQLIPGRFPSADTR